MKISNVLKSNFSSSYDMNAESILHPANHVNQHWSNLTVFFV